MTTTPTEEAPVVAIQPEVVDLPSDTHNPDAPLPVPHEEAAAALLERAADAALAPGVPGRDEFLVLAATARILSMSGAAPEAVRNNPYIAFHVALVGRDLDLSPSAALQLIDVISGSKGPQISLSPQLLNGRIERLGLGHIVKCSSTVESCFAVAVGPGGDVDIACRRSWPDHAEGCGCHGIIGDSEFTWDDARMAGLVAPQCQPGVHQSTCTTKGGSPRCNQGYKTYPKRMLWWRAAGFAADDWFPTASMGFYAPEALGAVVDEEGRPIDPSTIDLPDGYEPEKPTPPAVADEDTIAALRARIDALPAAARPVLMEWWAKVPEGGGPNYLQPLRILPERQVAKARALVAHFEERAAKGEWGPWEPPPAPTGGAPEPSSDGGDEGAADPTGGQDPAAGTAGDGAGDPPPPPVTETPAETPQDALSTDSHPGAAEAHSEAQGTESADPESCPVCATTGVLDGEPCWACTPAEACQFCGSQAHPRRLEAGNVLRCIDQDACWQREQAADPAMAALNARQATPGEAVDVESRELPAPPADAGEGEEPEACPICGSKRSVLVFVPHGHGQEGGVWRCQNGSACRERQKGKSGLEVARAALAEHPAEA